MRMCGTPEHLEVFQYLIRGAATEKAELLQVTQGKEEGKKAREDPVGQAMREEEGRSKLSSETNLHDRHAAMGFIRLMWGG